MNEIWQQSEDLLNLECQALFCAVSLFRCDDQILSTLVGSHRTYLYTESNDDGFLAAECVTLRN